jgi:hypothetical protein
MASSGGLTESEMGTWLFRVGSALIAVLLAFILKDAKKSLDMVPELVATIKAMKESQDALFRRVEELERERRK